MNLYVREGRLDFRKVRILTELPVKEVGLYPTGAFQGRIGPLKNILDCGVRRLKKASFVFVSVAER
jgi:hypothetical protein